MLNPDGILKLKSNVPKWSTLLGDWMIPYVDKEGNDRCAWYEDKKEAEKDLKEYFKNQNQ